MRVFSAIILMPAEPNCSGRDGFQREAPGGWLHVARKVVASSPHSLYSRLRRHERMLSFQAQGLNWARARRMWSRKARSCRFMAFSFQCTECPYIVSEQHCEACRGVRRARMRSPLPDVYVFIFQLTA
eukprot:2812695-Pleurochrysis_carterae.AAC.1